MAGSHGTLQVVGLGDNPISTQLGNPQNIEYLCHDITDAPLAEKFDKILMAGVTPCFSSFNAFELAMKNTFLMLRENGRAFISNNYDIASAKTAVEMILNSVENSAYAYLHIYENMLWLDFAEIKQITSAIGYRECTLLNPRTLTDGRSMFDFLLIK